MATAPATGVALNRVEGRAKVTGAARYAFEHPTERSGAYAYPVQATIAKGSVRYDATNEARALPGVLAVIWHEDAPKLQQVDDPELMLFQFPEVVYRGQIVAMVVAESLDTAREAASRVRVEYERSDHDVVLSAGRPDLYRPEKVNPRYEPLTERGEFEPAFERSAVKVDETYST